MSRWAIFIVLLWIAISQHSLASVQRQIVEEMDKHKELEKLAEEDLRGRVEERRNRHLPPLPPVRPS
jgi:hypothetical protein